MNDETFAFIISQTGWSLEYARSVPLQDMYLLASELRYLKAIEDYQQRINFAMLVSVMAKVWGGTDIEIEQMIGKPPERPEIIQKELEIWTLARRAKIKIPSDRR